MSDIEWTDATTERFWSKVDKSAGPDACWPWTGAKQAPGYGKLRVSGRSIFAHRIAVFLTNGAWPAVTLHTCDNPPCCNPAHLRAGTHRDNVRDCRAKGRARTLRGEESATARLTLALVRVVRERLARGDSLRAVGRDLGVGHTTIANVKLGKTWRAA